MKFKLDTPQINSNFKFSYKDKFAFIGSCFSNEILSYFNKFGLQTLDFPFGTIYNPLSIAQNISKIIDKDEAVFIENNNKIHHLDSNQFDHLENKNNFKKKINNQYKHLNKQFKDIDFLFITFGTAYSYIYKENNYIVANCQKITQDNFVKKLCNSTEIIDVWNTVIEKLKLFNPQIKLILTVSPVRHISDGLIENNKSKAKCFELISFLEKNKNIEYFPSYEIVIDELRDYRFYKEDLVHPNSFAIKYIWEILFEKYFDIETKNFIKKIDKFNKYSEHKILSKNKDAYHKHNLKLEEIKKNLIEEFPNYNFNKLFKF